MRRRDALKRLTTLPLAGGAITSAATTKARAQARAGGTQKRAGAAGDEWRPRKQVIRRRGQAAASGALLSSCIRSGHLLFVSGIGGWYADRRKEPGDAKVQIQSALTTMKETLENAGSSMANVLKVHMTVADPRKNLALLNEGYRGFFPDPPPVRSFTAASTDLMGRDGVLVQIDCIAYVD